MEQFEEPRPVVPTKKQNVMQGIKFTLFSASAGLIQIISFTLLNELAHLPYWPAYLIALVLSVVYNFTVNRRFTFKSTANVPRAMGLLLLYYAVFTPLSTWWGDALTNTGWNEYVVLIGTMLINFVTEFCVQRFVIYKNEMYTNQAGKEELEKLKG